MAEALAAIGLASSILTFISAGNTLVARLRDSADAFSGNAVFREIAAQLPLLIEIAQKIDRERLSGSIGEHTQQSLIRAVDGCERQIYLLNRLTGEVLPTPHDSWLLRTRKAFGSINKEKKVMEIQRTLETYKATLTLYFTQISGQRNDGSATAESDTYFEIPPTQISHFVGREDILGAINALMAGTTRGPRPTTVVLIGMGGQGKTQLALEYCRRQAGLHRAVFWIDATSPDTVVRSFGTISKKIAGSGRVFSDEETKVAFVKESLGALGSWLLVFDNFDDPSTFKDLRDYFPNALNGGAVLITSRHTDSERLGNVVAVSGMAEDEGVDLLFQRSGADRKGEDIAHAGEIVQRLGRLPLAIDQAGGYIRARRLPLSMFMEHYNNRRESVLKVVPDLWEYKRKLVGEESETPMSVFTTWEMSFAQIGSSDSVRAGIGHFLTLSAFLDATNTTENVFKTLSFSEGSTSTEWLELLTTNGNWDSYKFQDMISDLSKHSLIQSVDFRSSQCYFSIHPLIRDWLRLRLDPQDRKKLTAEAITVVTRLIEAETSSGASLQQKQEVVLHMDACVQNDIEFLDRESQLGSEHMRYPAIKFGTFYNTHGRYKDAELMFDRILTRYEKSRWLEFPDSISASMNLANVYRNQGRYNEAETLYKMALGGGSDKLPADHPDMLYTSEGLAIVYTAQGRYAEAESLYKHILTERNNRLGYNHLDVFRAMEGMSNVSRMQGRLEHAKSLCKRALDGYTVQLGPVHPDTLRTAQNLAVIYRHQRQYRDAEKLYKSSLEGYETQFGPNHPYTLRLIMNLAIVYHCEYRYEEAEALYGRTLAGLEEQLGYDHPDTLRTVVNLANVYTSQSRYQEAEGLYKRGVEGFAKHFGSQDTIYTGPAARALLNIYMLRGRTADAIALHDAYFPSTPKHPSLQYPLYPPAHARNCQSPEMMTSGTYFSPTSPHPSQIQPVNSTPRQYTVFAGPTSSIPLPSQLFNPPEMMASNTYPRSIPTQPSSVQSTSSIPLPMRQYYQPPEMVTSNPR